MPYTSRNLEEKPYNMCLDCIHIGKQCDGPNFLAMTTERWCEWCRLRKEYLGITNERIANESGVSLVSVHRVMSGNVKDIRISTMQGITRVLVNGTWGQYPCAMAAAAEDALDDVEDVFSKCAALEAEIISLKANEERKVQHLMDQIAFTRAEILQKNREIDHLIELLKARQ